MDHIEKAASRVRRFAYVFLAALLALVLLTTLNRVMARADEQIEPAIEPSPPSSRVTDLVIETGGLSFSVHTPPPTFIDGSLSSTGLKARIQEEDHPSLPYFSTMIVVPPQATVKATVKQVRVSIEEKVSVPPVARLRKNSISLDEHGQLQAVDNTKTEVRPDPVIYGQASFYPDQPYSLSDPMYYRDVRLVRLSLYPYRYNPVSGQLQHIGRFDVRVNYVGGSASTRAASGGEFASYQALADQVLNPEQLSTWRSFPAQGFEEKSLLPVGVPAYKLEVAADGIYEVTHADLVAAGMPSTSLDSAAMQLIYRGLPVAFDMDDGDDGQFQSGDSFRFYGWAFDGPRLERQFITRNVFWLITAGTISQSVRFDSVEGPLFPDFPSSTTFEEDNVWFPGYTDNWHLFPNEPDAWFVDKPTISDVPTTRSYSVTVFSPASQGPEAIYTVELGSDDDTNSDKWHTATVSIRGAPVSSTLSWLGEQNVNITGTIPLSYLVDGINIVDVQAYTEFGTARLALNRITIDYQRRPIANDNELLIRSNGTGARSYSVSGFQSDSANSFQVWDISNQFEPAIVNNDSFSVTGKGTSYTVTLGVNGNETRYIYLTSKENIVSPASVEQYTPKDLEPASGGADWLAISYKDFITEVQRLAEHRADSRISNMQVHVVDVDDVLNQYGYGLPLPGGISEYLYAALLTWSPAPRYALLVGDSTLDPRHILSGWTDEQFVPTYLEFVDRYQGQVPTDMGFSLLVGDDELADIGVGRLPVKTPQEAASAIDKIIRYDENQFQSFSWMENILFVADDLDSGGNFCLENQFVQEMIPSALNAIDLCLPENPTVDQVEALREQMFTYTNVTGTLILNFRGHGAVNTWAGFPEPILSLAAGHGALWNNPDRPVIIFTGNCLDGHFAYPPVEGLGEVFLRQEGNASAAHWGSSGLGLVNEHTALSRYFYEGLFSAGQTTLGDAINYAKRRFTLAGGHRSIPYTFSLLGDPAMTLMRPSLSLDMSSAPSTIRKDEVAEVRLEIENLGLYPSAVSVIATIPAGFEFLSADSSVSVETLLFGDQVTFDLQFGEDLLDKGIPRNSSVSLIMTAIASPAASPGKVDLPAGIVASGQDAWPGDESGLVSFFVIGNDVYLPMVRRP